MRAHRSLLTVIIALMVIAIVTATQLSPAQTEAGGDRQVVAAVAANSVTEYEPDPFEPQRVRSSTVRVRQVAVVYSDGSVELKRVDG